MTTEGVEGKTALKADGHHVQVMTLEPGATIPPHAHATGYIVYPHTDMHVIRTTHHAGKAVREDTVHATALAPYAVAATAPGYEITVTNKSDHIIVFGKITHHPPKLGA